MASTPGGGPNGTNNFAFTNSLVGPGAIGQIGTATLGGPSQGSGAMNQYLQTTVTVGPWRGTFGADSSRGLRDMTDGTTNSLIVGERYTPQFVPPSFDEVGFASWTTTPDVTWHWQSYVIGEASLPINYAMSSSTPRPPTTGFGSVHAGGCHFLMGDGSVRFISQNIDMTAFRTLACVNDGGVVGDF